MPLHEFFDTLSFLTTIEHVIFGALVLCALVAVGILKSLRPEGPPYDHPRPPREQWRTYSPSEAELRAHGYIIDIPDEPETLVSTRVTEHISTRNYGQEDHENTSRR